MSGPDASGTSTTALASSTTSDLTTKLNRFFSNLSAVGALYKTDATWKITPSLTSPTDTTTLKAFTPPVSTDTSGTAPLCIHFTPTVLFAAPGTSEASDQPYWNPEIIAIPSDWARSILVISLTTGALGSIEDNRQAHAFRVTNTDQIFVEYLGAFGGATSSALSNPTTADDDDNPKSALGTPPAPIIGQKAPDDVLIQTSFSLVNTLTQRTDPSWTAALSLQYDHSVGSDPTNGVSVQLQVGNGLRYPQLTPPPPTFVASCNVILKKTRPTFLATMIFTVPFDTEGKVVIDHDEDVKQLNDQINGPNGLGHKSPDGGDPTDLRPAIRQGLIPVHLTGYASETGAAGHNVTLAGQRCDAVRVLLAGANSAGSGTQGGLLGDGQIAFQVLALGSLNPPTTSVSGGRFVEIRFDGQEVLDGLARYRATKPSF